MHRFSACLLVALVALAGVPAGSAASAPSPVAQSDAPAQSGALAQSGAPACEYPLTVTDATGTEVTVAEPPERVVVTGASGAQTMWELGARSTVVGMPIQPWTAYLEGRESKRDVSNAGGGLNVEKTIAANPDLVLAANITAPAKLEQLRAANVTVYTFAAADSLSYVYEKTNTTGALVGACDAAAETVSEMRATVSAVEARAEGKTSPRTFVYGAGGYTVPVNSFRNDILTTAGATNIASGLNVSRYGEVSREAVIAADPAYIVVPVQNASVDPAAQLPDAYDNVTAVREGQVVGVNVDYFSQPAPRVTRPLVTLSEAFYGGNVSAPAETSEVATDQTAGTSESTSTTAERTSTTAETTTTQSGGTPGFGAPAAVLALVAGLFAARRE